MKIDVDNPTPKYVQLKEIVKRYLKDQNYEAGHKIPSELELMEQFDVSRGTVRQTLGELVNEGTIYRQRGRGSFYSGKDCEQQSRSHLVGVIMPHMSSYIYPKIIQGINDVAQKKRYNIVLGGSYVNPEKELSCIKRLIDRELDGLIIEPSGGVTNYLESPNFQYLKSLPFPVVFMDWELDDPDVACVSVNDREGGLRATRYLIEAGHRRIACISTNDHIPGLARNEGYRKALQKAGIPYDPLLDKSASILQWIDRNRPYGLMQELLRLDAKERPTAIFCFNDYAASQGCIAIREAGLRVPDDISIIGFDNSELAMLAEVPLTTVVHPKQHIGQWAAEILFDQLENTSSEIPRQILFNPDIIERDSVKFIN